LEFGGYSGGQKKRGGGGVNGRGKRWGGGEGANLMKCLRLGSVEKKKSKIERRELTVCIVTRRKRRKVGGGR